MRLRPPHAPSLHFHPVPLIIQVQAPARAEYIEKRDARMKKPIRFSYSLSNEDVLAILAALPLVPAFDVGTEIQQSLNENLCLSAMNKLVEKRTELIPNEIRVIALSIELAVDFLAGRLELDIDQETASEIRLHIFTYNRLHEAFGPLLDRLKTQLDS